MTILDSAQFSPDGQRVVTASGDKTARFWDATWQTNRRTDEASRLFVSAQFSPDGQRVVTASDEIHTARLWDAGNR